jgi:hypothetical protein
MATAPTPALRTTGPLRCTGGHPRPRRVLHPSSGAVARVRPAGEGSGGGGQHHHPPVHLSLPALTML